MYKTMLKYMGDNRKYAVLSPIMVILEVMMDITIPYVMSLIIDKGIIRGDTGEIIRYALILLLMVITSLIGGVASAYFATKAAAGFSGNLRAAVFRNIQTFSFKNIDQFKVGSLVTRLTTDVQNVQMAFQMSIRIAVRAPLMFIFAFFMAYKLSPKISMNFLMIVPAMLVVMIFLSQKAHGIFAKAYERIDDMNMVVSENLKGIRVVKSFVKGEAQTKKFAALSENLMREYMRADKLISLVFPVMNLSTYSLVLILAWAGSRMIVGGEMTTGALMSLITYAVQLQISLMMLSMILVMLTIAKNSHRRIKEVLDVKSDIVSKENAKTDVEDGSIEFDNVNFSYVDDMDKLSLIGINLNIKSGDYVGIMGPTGSSKSTLINLIARLYDVSTGSVKVGGTDVRDYDVQRLRDSVAVVLQKNVLFSGTVRSNMHWADKNLTDEQIWQALEIASAGDFVREAGGLDAKVERGGVNFSGGQRQRLCIARAILKRPKILIMDDSTSALDNTTEKNIISALNRYMPDMTKIIISQRITSLKSCDYIVVMDMGQIENAGTHKELMQKSEIYSEIAELSENGGDFDERK